MIFVFRKTQSGAIPYRGIPASKVISGNGQRYDNNILEIRLIRGLNQSPRRESIVGTASPSDNVDVCVKEFVNLLAAFWDWRFRFISALVQIAWPVRIESGGKAGEVKRCITGNRANGVVVSGQESSFIFGQPHGRESLEQQNDQDHAVAAV